MAVNKVIYKTTTLIDLSSDTVTPQSLGVGETAHNKAGELITGVAIFGGVGELQEKSVTLTDNGTTNIVADAQYDGLSKVTVTVAVPLYMGAIEIDDIE